MAFDLPSLSRSEFAQGVAPLSPEPLDGRAIDALFAHYQELARWNRRTNLIGPGTAGEILARHFGESLAALPLVPENARVGLDLGSGAGFPGLVLAAARLGPDPSGLEMTLAEAREKKWAFLAAAARKASLPCRCLNVRVQVPLPAGLPERIDVITSRALRLDPETWGALANRLTPEGRILLWAGENDPDLPPDLVARGGVKLAGSERRRILALQPSTPPAMKST
ncbi:MAG TPA: RsmG family class I SAM-dependent methyltransferase [Thermoanaerobaculia bacterium]|jgi:16S rRNA (guanine(527)-N(7))-methyltransferase RsmG|nr:RsmG family class I SAM-dependent methyltransferase [Thermoanaerobaculia bacterium]